MEINNVRIKSNEEIAQDIWEMKFEAPKIAALYKGAGQFINILASDDWEHALRRPMSISAVDADTLSFIYKISGPVTKLLKSKKELDSLNILGPLGNIFLDWDNLHNFPILVGGGTGLAPLLNLHNNCLTKGIKHALILGARNKFQHFLDHDPQNGVYLCTDDGSLGIKGTVMAALESVLKTHKNAHIFTCGPAAMLKAIQFLAIKKQIACQLSVESYMACGTGLCQGCAIGINSSSSEKNYSLVCSNGPVYKAEEVLFD